MAEGDRRLTREEVVELADAVAGQRRDRLRHRDDALRRPARRRGRRPRTRRSSGDRASSSRGRGQAGLPAWPISPGRRAVSEDDDELDEDVPR